MRDDTAFTYCFEVNQYQDLSKLKFSRSSQVCATPYREYIQTLLTRYASDDVSDDEVEVQLVFDLERDHYQWMNVGWQAFNRVYRCIMHFDIKDGKIWLQQNLTDQNPAEELVAMGVPKEDIVLGLQPPYKRQYTEYGVA